MYKLEINLKYKPDFEYGQHLWTIEPVRFADKVFTTPCPVCGGTKMITHNGYDLKCPYCAKGFDAENEIRMCRYEVCEYIINELIISGEHVKAAYTKDGLAARPPHISRCAGFRVSSRYSAQTNRSFHKLARYENPDFETLISPRHGYNITDYYFTDKKLANARLNELIESDKARLAEFNEKNKANYEYPW